MKNNRDLDLYSHCGFAHEYQCGYSITVGEFPKPIEHPNFAEAEAHNTRGIAYSQKGEQNKAIEAFSKAIDLKPDYANAHYNLGLAYLKKGEVDEAWSASYRAIQCKRNYAEAYNNRGIAYQLKGETIYAIQDYTMAIGLNQKLTEAYTNRGGLYLDRLDIQHALDDFHIAIKLDSDAGLAYGHAGVAYLHYQHWKKTKADWTVAAILRVDIRPLFYTRYGSIAAFTQKTGIQLPADVVDMLCPDKPIPEFEEGARLKLALKAYDREELSTGLSARLAGMSREAFIYAMGKHGLSPFGETSEDLREDAESARKARNL
ncbi:hypothetical protein C6503_04480 [Candidatus Poribacteria bacterium]|nr:MAG: hypothetical protein C6503_04480 [Candidatus Poribacteria bacterium]